MIESIGASLIVSSAKPDSIPRCWEMQPGTPKSEVVGWYLNGEHVLDTPVSWDINRSYEELSSQGWCVLEETIIQQSAQEVFDKVDIVLPPPPPPPPPKPLEVTDWVLQRAIGRAEGTRDKDGNPNHAFYGHNDPGWSGRCQNIGSFSYQHCASSPEAADKIWLGVLRNTAQPLLNQKSVEKFGHHLSSAALVVGLDAWTQSPDAGSRYVKFLDTHDPTPQQLINARINALNESRRILGGPRNFNVGSDQRRRVRAILGQLQILHEEQLQKEGN